MEKSELQDLGFSEGEAEIYTALLRLGSATVVQLARSTGRHRTHIYDTVEKLKMKGMISESVINNKRVFISSDPKNILDYLKEKEMKAQDMIAKLKISNKSNEKEMKVETFDGKDGLKSVLRDILREQKNYIGYGEGTRFKKVLPVFYEQFVKQSENLGIELKLILKKGVWISKREKLFVRYLDYISPSTVFIYGNKVLTIIWEPVPTAIRISNEQVAESYRNYFNVLWKSASKQ